MARQVNKYESDAGGLFDTEYDAIKDDLRAYFAKATENEAITRKLIEQISADMPGFYHLIKGLEDARPEQPEAAPTRIAGIDYPLPQLTHWPPCLCNIGIVADCPLHNGER
jgi:hypothetical protein